jgi:hypothetical protein
LSAFDALDDQEGMMMHFTRQRHPTKIVTRLLVAALIGASTVAAPVGARTVQHRDTWDQVSSAPAGVRLRLTLHDGSKVAGTVVDAGPDAVTLENAKLEEGRLTTPAGSSPTRRTFQRVEVVDIESLTIRYRATGPVDAATVRHVIRALGAGKKIQLTTTSQELRGTIHGIGPDRFTIDHGLRGISESIPYSDVREVGPSALHTAVKTALVAGALGAAVVIWFFAQIS